MVSAVLQQWYDNVSKLLNPNSRRKNLKSLVVSFVNSKLTITDASAAPKSLVSAIVILLSPNITLTAHCNDSLICGNFLPFLPVACSCHSASVLAWFLNQCIEFFCSMATTGSIITYNHSSFPLSKLNRTIHVIRTVRFAVAWLEVSRLSNCSAQIQVAFLPCADILPWGFFTCKRGGLWS